MDDRNNAKVIKASFHYLKCLDMLLRFRTLSSGRATFLWSSRYEPAPTNIAEEVIAKAKVNL